MQYCRKRALPSLNLFSNSVLPFLLKRLPALFVNGRSLTENISFDLNYLQNYFNLNGIRLSLKYDTYLRETVSKSVKICNTHSF